MLRCMYVRKENLSLAQLTKSESLCQMEEVKRANLDMYNSL